MQTPSARGKDGLHAQAFIVGNVLLDEFAAQRLFAHAEVGVSAASLLAAHAGKIKVNCLEQANQGLARAACSVGDGAASVIEIGRWPGRLQRRRKPGAAFLSSFAKWIHVDNNVCFDTSLCPG